MNEKIFRAKSLERIQSPDNLNEYVRVSDPAVWLLLIAVIALLAGALIWSVFGHIDSVIQANTQVEDGVARCYIDKSDADGLKEGAVVHVDGVDGFISEILGIEDDVCVCDVTTDTPLADGLYTCEIVTESINPISFIIN